MTRHIDPHEVQREGARRAGVEPDGGDVLRASVRALIALERVR